MPAKKNEKPGAGLDAALAHINKTYGDGSIMRLGDGSIGPVSYISTGSIGLDHALGVGGLPRGRVIEIYGPEGTGKTTLALHAAATCQNSGGTVAFIDAEHALDPDYAKQIGVDVENLWISQPDCGEEGLEIADMLLRSGDVDLIIVDSVAALVPQAEIDGSMGDSHVGLQARLMGQALRKLTSGTSPDGAAIIFINQLREKVGVMFGSPEVTAGGKALPYYSSVRLDVRRIQTLKDPKTNEAIGSRLRIKVAKNKLSPPFRVCEFDLTFGLGIDQEGELLDHAVGAMIIRKNGAFYTTMDGQQLGQGKLAASRFLRENTELAAQLREKVMEALRTGVSVVPAEPEPAGRGKAPL
jgi:recombination protein RecA